MTRVEFGGGHQPVLLTAALAVLEPAQGGTFVDATFGAGHYSTGLICGGADRVVAIDRDPDAVASGQTSVAQHASRLVLHHATFARLGEIVRADESNGVKGVVFDLGVSSNQLDNADRGFSIRHDGPLDMRMERVGRSAFDLVNTAKELDLTEILRVYGEEPRARRVARAIVQRRKSAPIQTTGELADLVVAALGQSRVSRIHPATRTFQAIRIAVNDELNQLRLGLAAAVRVLQPGGVLCVVSFHSLEDRLVKRFGRDLSGSTGTYRHLPAVAGAEPVLQVITRRPVRPTPEEVNRNPRSRSARLRAFRRTTIPMPTAVGEAASSADPEW